MLIYHISLNCRDLNIRIQKITNRLINSLTDQFWNTKCSKWVIHTRIAYKKNASSYCWPPTYATCLGILGFYTSESQTQNEQAANGS